MGKKRKARGLLGKVWDRFGDVAKRLGFAGDSDVKQALDHQEERKAARRPHKKIGQILVDRGKMGGGEVREVLKQQKKVAKKATKAKTPKKAATRAPKKVKKKAAKKKAKK